MITAAAICSFLLIPGDVVECEAYYLHTVPGGGRYYSVVSDTPNIFRPLMATCSGEGHPFMVEMKVNGVVACRDEVPIFKDGLESGDTSEWN